MARPRLRAAVAAAVLLATAVAGCSAPDRSGPDGASGTSAASGGSPGATPASPTSAAPSEPSTDDDFRALYVGLVPELYAFVRDPLHAPAEAIDCASAFMCGALRRDARKGRLWKGVDEENLTVGPVTVLERVNPVYVALVVTLTLHGPVTLVDRKGKVLEKRSSTRPVRTQVRMVRVDGRWRLLTGAFGNSWDLPLPSRTSFDTRTYDPLDTPLTPASDVVTAAHGVRWQRLGTATGDDCLRVWKPRVDVLVSCVTFGRKATPSSDQYLMRITKFRGTQQWVSLWFARGQFRTGYEIYADGSEHATTFRTVGATSTVWRYGIGVLPARPESITALRGRQRLTPSQFDWPPGGPK